MIKPEKFEIIIASVIGFWGLKKQPCLLAIANYNSLWIINELKTLLKQINNRIPSFTSSDGVRQEELLLSTSDDVEWVTKKQIIGLE